MNYVSINLSLSVSVDRSVTRMHDAVHNMHISMWEYMEIIM